MYASAIIASNDSPPVLLYVLWIAIHPFLVQSTLSLDHANSILYQTFYWNGTHQLPKESFSEINVTSYT